MKKIEVTTYSDKVLVIENFLKQKNLPYQKISGETYEGHELFRYVVFSPDELASSLIQSLSKIVDTNQRDVLISSEDVEATISNYLDDFIDKIKKPKKVPRIVEELIPLTEPFTHFKKDLFVMVIIASMVSLVGLFSDSPAIVIGAMLIAPLIGPVTAFSFNAATGNPKKTVKTATFGLSLIVAVMVSSAIATLVVSSFVDISLTDEIMSRTDNTIVDVLVGIALGVAGGIAMVSTIPGILVGVAIAAALVPPASVTGIGMAMQNMDIFSGGLILTSSNVIGLVLGCMIVFYFRGISPRKYYEKATAKKYLAFSIVFFALLGILLTVFIGVFHP